MSSIASTPYLHFVTVVFTMWVSPRRCHRKADIYKLSHCFMMSAFFSSIYYTEDLGNRICEWYKVNMVFCGTLDKNLFSPLLQNCLQQPTGFVHTPKKTTFIAKYPFVNVRLKICFKKLTWLNHHIMAEITGCYMQAPGP